jgi:hypothetical protein
MFPVVIERATPNPIKIAFSSIFARMLNYEKRILLEGIYLSLLA